MKWFVLYQFISGDFEEFGNGQKSRKDFTTEDTEYTEKVRNPRGRSELRPYMIFGEGDGLGVGGIGVGVVGGSVVLGGEAEVG